MINLILFGPPGSGKGTQAAKLIEKYGFNHVSTGEVIRNEIRSGTLLGKAAARQMEGGGLVDNYIVCEIIDSYITNNKDVKGIIYDGFPRTVAQAQVLDKILERLGNEVTKVIALTIDDDEIVRRITERGKISGRDDDQSVPIIRNRIAVYKEQTEAVGDHYAEKGKYEAVDGSGTIDETFEKLCAIIENLN